MRWQVKLNDMTGDVLVEALKTVGFDLDGDMLFGEPFENLDEWGAVADLARELSQRIQEIARLNPDIEMGFTPGKVHEYDADGNLIGEHHKVYAQGAVSLAFAGTVAGVAVGGQELTPEEQAEIERQARAAKAAELMRATTANDAVFEVLRLFEGEPWGTELGHVHELILDDVNGEISPYASARQLARFNRSINHPHVLGMKARHAIPQGDPPSDPMTLEEATQFMKEIARKWICELAEREND